MIMNKPGMASTRYRRAASVRFLEKIRKTVEKRGLLAPGDKVLIAYSGGPDSTALLEVLSRLQESSSLRLAMAHFNHLLRRSAADDEEFAAEQARRHGLPFYLGREDIRAYASEASLNLEEAGRGRRYAFLKSDGGPGGREPDRHRPHHDRPGRNRDPAAPQGYGADRVGRDLAVGRRSDHPAASRGRARGDRSLPAAPKGSAGARTNRTGTAGFSGIGSGST